MTRGVSTDGVGTPEVMSGRIVPVAWGWREDLRGGESGARRLRVFDRIWLGRKRKIASSGPTEMNNVKDEG